MEDWTPVDSSSKLVSLLLRYGTSLHQSKIMIQWLIFLIVYTLRFQYRTQKEALDAYHETFRIPLIENREYAKGVDKRCGIFGETTVEKRLMLRIDSLLPIIKWIAVTWCGWEGTRRVVPLMAARRHTPFAWLCCCALVRRIVMTPCGVM